MRYRVRSRRAKAARYVLSLDMLTHSDWTRAEYVALRDEVLRLFSHRLDGFEPFWEHEPGVPEHLRTMPWGGATHACLPWIVPGTELSTSSTRRPTPPSWPAGSRGSTLTALEETTTNDQ